MNRNQLMLKRYTLAISVLGLVAATVAWAAPSTAPDGFVSLFNGKDLSGWKIPDGDNGHWKVVDGVIDYDAGSESRGDKSLWTDREYVDFELRLDWRIKEALFINKNIPYILPDGTHAKDSSRARKWRWRLPDADSGFRAGKWILSSEHVVLANRLRRDV